MFWEKWVGHKKINKERKKKKPTPSIKSLVLGSCCRLYFIIIKFFRDYQ
jgi:hypothetical protein